MQRALVVAIVLAALVLGGLLVRRALTAVSTSETASGGPVPDLFLYRADVELGARRADTIRLGGALDLSMRDLDRACESDEAALSIVQTAIASHPIDDALVREVARLPELCFEPPNPPGLCVWAASEIERHGPLTEAAWAMLTHCPSGVASPFFDSPDAPALRVLEFVASRRVGSPWLRPPPRLPSQYARAVFELASRPELIATWPFVGGTDIRYDDATASEVLVHAYESAPDPARALLVAHAIGVLSDTRARAIARTVCTSAPTTPLCREAAADTTERMLDAASYVERHPTERARVIDELDACARADVGADGIDMRATCLARLATLDWARARTVAPDLDPQANTELAGVVQSLTQFPSAADLVLALRTRSLLGEPRATEALGVTVVSVMAAYGRGWTISAASALGHDRLARHLLRLGGLEDVDVDETFTDPTGPLALVVRSTRLRAFTPVGTFVATTTSDGDYYDLDAIVGLLNVVARTRGANVRYLVVVDPLAEEAIVLGPPDELASAVAQGLLETPGATAPNLTAPNLPF